MSRKSCKMCGQPARPPMMDYCTPRCAEIDMTRGRLSRLRNTLLVGAAILVGIPFVPVLLWGLPGLLGLGALLLAAGGAAHLMRERLGRPSV